MRQNKCKNRTGLTMLVSATKHGFWFLNDLDKLNVLCLREKRRFDCSKDVVGPIWDATVDQHFGDFWCP